MDVSKNRDYGKAGKSKILVIGDIILERYIIGISSGVCQGLPVPVISIHGEKWLPGGAASLAVNIQDMDGSVALAGVVGMDNEGERVKKMISDLGIPMILSMDASRPTAVRQNVTADGRLIVCMDNRSNEEIPGRVFNELVKIIMAMSDDMELILIADYGGGVVTADLMGAISHICRNKRVVVYMASICNDFVKYKDIDMIYIDQYILEYKLGKKLKVLRDLENAADYVFNNTYCKSLVINLGINGLIMFKDSPGERIHIPFPSRADMDIIPQPALPEL